MGRVYDLLFKEDDEEVITTDKKVESKVDKMPINMVAIALRILSIIIFIIAFIMFILALFNFVLFIVVISLVVSGLLILGIAEIIRILDNIRYLIITKK